MLSCRLFSVQPFHKSLKSLIIDLKIERDKLSTRATSSTVALETKLRNAQNKIENLEGQIRRLEVMNKIFDEYPGAKELARELASAQLHIENEDRLVEQLEDENKTLRLDKERLEVERNNTRKLNERLQNQVAEYKVLIEGPSEQGAYSSLPVVPNTQPVDTSRPLKHARPPRKFRLKKQKKTNK